MSVFISIVIVNILIKMYDYLTGFPALSQSGPSSPIYFTLNTGARIHLPKILYVSESLVWPSVIRYLFTSLILS